MEIQIDIFGQNNLIKTNKKPHSGCGCFTDAEESERKQSAILAYFLRGKSLTVLQAIKQFHTTELRKTVCRLKNKGHNMVSYWHIEDGKKKYKVYRLAKEVKNAE